MPRFPTLFSVFVFLGFASQAVCGDNRVFRTFDNELLSFGVVYSVAQDPDGFIWYGGTGIYRFDGTNVIDIHDFFSGQSLPARAFRLMVDSEGGLWILGYENDLYYCDIAARTATTVVAPDTRGSIFDIRPGRGREIIAGTDNGLLSIRINGGGTTFARLSRWPARAIDRCAENGMTVAASYDAIYFLDENYGVVSSSPIALSPGKNVRNVHRLDDDSALLGAVSAGGLWLFSGGKTVPLIENVSVYNIRYNSREQRFWIATDEGIYTYDNRTSEIANIRKKGGDPFSLPDNFVCSLMQDTEGGIWAGTYFKGLCYCPNLPLDMTIVSADSDHPGFNGNVVRAFGEDGYGNLWISTEDEGLYKLDKKSGAYTGFSPKNSKTPLGSFNIRGTLAVGSELWIATLDNGIYIMDIPSGRILRNYNRHTAPGLITDNIQCFALWKDDIYAGTEHGLFRFDRGSGTFEMIYQGIINYVTSLHADSKNRLWCTSYYKVSRMDGNGITIYELSPEEPDSLSVTIPFHVNEDDRGNIWVAGLGGLSRYTGDDAAPFVNYMTENESLSGLNELFRVEPDRFGTLWCSSSRGVTRFNPKTGQREIYTSKDYLNNSRFYNASYRDASGNIYIGTLDGYVKIAPSEPVYSTKAPDIHLTEISYKHPATRRDTSVYFLPSERAAFRHFQNGIGFEYSVPEYTLLNNIEYSYRLKGLERDSTTTIQNRPVTYQNLPPGNYTFIIGARYLFGSGEVQYAEYGFRIAPPFASSVWGFILYFMLLSALVVAAAIYRRRQTVKKQQEIIKDFENRKEKELYDAKILFFTNIAHEIRTPLTLIKLPLEQLASAGDAGGENEQLDLIEKNVDRLTRLCTQLLDFRSSEKDALHLNFVQTDIGGLLEEIVSHFAGEIKRRGIELTVSAAEKIIADVDAEAFTKICSNLVNNAVKYCENRIEIRLESRENTFSLSILNDGELIPAADSENIFTLFYRSDNSLNKIGSGVGLAFTKQLVEMHNGRLELVFDAQDRNHFRITLPLNQKTLPGDDRVFDSDEAEAAGFDLNLDPARETVLLVEDDKQLRSYESKRLSAKYNVIAVPNGRKALDVLQGLNTVSLVVSDIIMPVMNGLALCSRIKSSIEFSHIPVILLTSREDAETRLESLAYGADDYITKPFSMEYLLLRIDNIIRNRKKIYNKVNSEGFRLIPDTGPPDSEEVAFLKRFSGLVEDELGNSALNMDYLADKMHVSRSALYKKVKSAADISPNDYIRIARLRRAVQLLVSGNQMIKDVAYAVGFSSTTYFSTCFVRQYGMSPSEYLKHIAPDKFAGN